MDGIEWKRRKWKLPHKTWLYINERLGCWLGDHLIADHPYIKAHLSSRINSPKITMIPYGAEKVETADLNLLTQYNLIPNQYLLVIARTEPENHLREIVSAFSKKKRGLKLVILGRYIPDKLPYDKKVVESASDEVMFLGAIYDKPIVQALRFYTRLYIHGHSVGGTNPSLVEALAAGSPILAHDNGFNRWVTDSQAHYFKDQSECESKLDELLSNPTEIKRMKTVSLNRYQEEFIDANILQAYEKLLLKFP